MESQADDAAAIHDLFLIWCRNEMAQLHSQDALCGFGSVALRQSPYSRLMMGGGRGVQGLYGLSIPYVPYVQIVVDRASGITFL